MILRWWHRARQRILSLDTVCHARSASAYHTLPLLAALLVSTALAVPPQGNPVPKPSSAMVGAYYFGGWAGRNPHASDTDQAWARFAPTHLTRRMLEEFPGREPLWGWRDDSPTIMKEQIDLATAHGVSFFAFCWYWSGRPGRIDLGGIDRNPRHQAMKLFRQAANNRDMKYCLMIANHQGAEIVGTDSWKQAADHWLGYFRDSNYLKLDGKPLLVIFHPQGADPAGLAYLRSRALELGFPGILVAGCSPAPNDSNFDLATNYNVHRGIGPGGRHAYAELAGLNRDKWVGSPRQRRIPVVTSGWDRRPWEGPGGFASDSDWYFPDRTPAQFRTAFSEALDWTRDHPDEATSQRVILVYAWNELGEGGYLIPTKADPKPAYLEAIRDALRQDRIRDGRKK